QADAPRLGAAPMTDMSGLDLDDGHPELVFVPSEIDGMRRALGEAGCFVVRNLFNREAILRARVRAAAVARKFDAMVARGETAGYEKYLTGAYQAGHLPEAELDVTMTRSELLEPSPYSAIAESLFGMASFGFALRRSFFNGSPNPLVFHQDGAFFD